MIKNIAALTIAGSDSGGGAGIQADLKTFSALEIYGTTVITSVTAQNHQEITDIFELPREIIQKQIEAVFNGYPIKALKTGILYSEDIIDIVVNSLSERIKKDNLRLVIDPVMISTSGKAVLDKKAIIKMQSELFPLASLVTPNIPESEYLSKIKIDSSEDIKTAASFLYKKYKVPFLLKGGHFKDGSNDILIDETGIKTLNSEKISGVDTHGSGCTLSAAITAFLCQNYSLSEAVNFSKEYINSSLLDPIQISENIQIINHFNI